MSDEEDLRAKVDRLHEVLLNIKGEIDAHVSGRFRYTTEVWEHLSQHIQKEVENICIDSELLAANKRMKQHIANLNAVLRDYEICPQCFWSEEGILDMLTILDVKRDDRGDIEWPDDTAPLCEKCQEMFDGIKADLIMAEERSVKEYE